MKELYSIVEKVLLENISSEDGSFSIETCVQQISKLCSDISIDFQCQQHNMILGKPESHPITTKLYDSVSNQFKLFIEKNY